MERLRRLPRRLVSLGARLGALAPVGVGLVLLAAVFFGTVQGVDRATRDAQDRRLTDRQDVARGFARAIETWFATGRTEAAQVAESFGQLGQRSIETYVSQRNAFGTDVVIVDPNFRVISGSGRYFGIVGRVPSTCAGDQRLRDVVAGLGDGDSAVPGVLPTPVNCEDRVLALARRGNRIAIIEADPAAAGLRLEPAVAIGPEGGGMRPYLIDPAGRLVGPHGLLTEEVPERVRELVADRSDGRMVRYTHDVGGDAELVAAFEPAADGWAVVLEQSTDQFDIGVLQRPATVVASTLTLALAVVFVLLTIFEVRRIRAARRSDVAKNQFFSIAGHELRTPLTSLRGLSETLSMRWNDLDDARRQAIVERLAPQTRRLTRTLEKLLLASGINADTYARPSPQPVDVAPILNAVVQRFKSEAPLHTFSVRTSDDLPEAVADPNALDQVLEQLVENAVRYSPQGGRVRVQAVATGRRAINIAVDDEGVGLPADAKRIFEPLVQGESVEGRIHGEGGVGVGLFVAKRLVDDMGGSVRAFRRKNGGSRFVVALRAVRARDRAPAESAG